MPEPSPFSNPYAALTDDQKTRTTIDISSADRAAIQAIHPKSGIIQTTINIFLTRLVQELQRNNIKDYDPGVYERAIAGLELKLGGFNGSVGGTAAKSRTTKGRTKPAKTA